MSLIGGPPAAIWVLLFVALVGFAAWRLRPLAVPGWLGAPARLAEAVLGLSIALLLAEVLGLVGGLHGLTLELGAAVIAAASWAVSRRPRLRAHPPAPAGLLELGGAGALALVLVAIWMLGTLAVLDGGAMVFDSLWYHLPLAAGFAQTGSITHLQSIDPLTLARFYPADSELVHAIGMTIVHRDAVSPLVAVGWMALALVGGWCIGRRLGVAVLSMLGVGVVLGAHVLAASQPGNATNDVVTVAAVVCSAALLVEAFADRLMAPGMHGEPRGAVFLAGLAAGLAAGTKLNAVVPVAALTVGVPFLVPRGRRTLTLGAWLSGAVFTGALWYTRNAIATGTPLPWLHSIGPIDLPSPADAAGLRPAFTVVHYLTDGTAWSDYFVPGLRVELGDLWPLTLALAAGGILLAIARRRSPAVIRLVGLTALAGAVVYVLTPLSAGGPEGHPVTFATNLRWLAPFLAVGLAVLPAAVADRPRAWRLAVGALMVAPLAASLDLSSWGSDPNLAAALLVAFAAVATWAAVIAARRSARLPTLAVPALVTAFAVAAAAVYASASRDYLRDRFQAAPAGTGLSSAWRWGQRTGGAGIALGGTSAAFHQYPFYGRQLSNDVTYVAESGPNGSLRPIAGCPRWRRAIDSGRFDFVVTAPRFDPEHPSRALPSPERRWARSPAMRPVVESAGATVYRVRGPLDPASCPGKGNTSKGRNMPP